MSVTGSEHPSSSAGKVGAGGSAVARLQIVKKSAAAAGPTGAVYDGGGAFGPATNPQARLLRTTPRGASPRRPGTPLPPNSSPSALIASFGTRTHSGRWLPPAVGGA